MDQKILLLQNAEFDKYVSLNKTVLDSRYLLLDLWNNPSKEEYHQILLQLDRLKISGIDENRISFDITNNGELIGKIKNLESRCIDILRGYLQQIKKKGKFNFMSILKNDESNIFLTLATETEDYKPSLFDNIKNRVSFSYFHELPTNITVNILLELYGIKLDMISGNITVDIRLRLMIENMIAPTRTKINNVDFFIQNAQTTETVEDVLSDTSDNADEETPYTFSFTHNEESDEELIDDIMSEIIQDAKEKADKEVADEEISDDNILDRLKIPYNGSAHVANDTGDDLPNESRKKKPMQRKRNVGK